MVDHNYVLLPYVSPVKLVEPLGQGLVLLEIFPLPSFDHFLVLVLKLNHLPRYGCKLLSAKFSKVVGHVLVDRVGNVQHFNALLMKFIHEVRYLHLCNVGSYKEVYLILPFLHPLHALREGYVIV